MFPFTLAMASNSEVERPVQSHVHTAPTLKPVHSPTGEAGTLAKADRR
jgi:hypothetical protein